MSVTIKDIAKVANVSYATVSRALNDHPEINQETKKKILRISQEMGYTPNEIAKGLVTRNSNTVGLIIPDITNPFFPEVAQGIEDCANRNGFQVFLCNTNWELEREKKYLSTLYGKRVDGMIIAPSSNQIEHLAGDQEKGIPTVFAAYNPLNEDYNYVVTDDYQSACIAMEYLIKLGHKRIAFIGGQQESSTDVERFRGYADSLQKHNIPQMQGYVRHGKYKQESGHQLTKELLLNNETPTAILAGNDIIALGVIQAVEEFGLKVPDHISVVGFDDISFAALDKIQLTTVHQPKYKIGELCFEILLQKIKNPEDKRGARHILEPKLVIRKTSKGV